MITARTYLPRLLIIDLAGFHRLLRSQIVGAAENFWTIDARSIDQTNAATVASVVCQAVDESDEKTSNANERYMQYR